MWKSTEIKVIMIMTIIIIVIIIIIIIIIKSKIQVCIWSRHLKVYINAEISDQNFEPRIFD